MRLLHITLLFAVAVAFGCSILPCSHGSWAKTDGWQCHDWNDERGPQRDRRPR